jgi:hypothetical protein
MLMSATTHDDFIGVEKFGNWDKLVFYNKPPRLDN